MEQDRKEKDQKQVGRWVIAMEHNLLVEAVECEEVLEEEMLTRTKRQKIETATTMQAKKG